MANRLLERLPFGTRTIVHLPREVALHALVRSAGRSRESGTEYDWDGRNRGSRAFAVLQVTLDGCGILESERGSTAVSAGRAMLALIPGTHRYRIHPKAAHWEFVYAVLHGRELMRLLSTGLGTGVFDWDSGGSAERSLYRLVRVLLTGERATPYALSELAYSAAMSLFDSRHRPTGTSKDSRIVLAEEHVRNHLDAPLSVEELATVAGYSRHHFSRQFKLSTGLSPVRFIREERCGRAATLLVGSLRTVKEIAHECGFESESYFCRVFREITGVTPSEFRRTRP